MGITSGLRQQICVLPEAKSNLWQNPPGPSRKQTHSFCSARQLPSTCACSSKLPSSGHFGCKWRSCTIWAFVVVCCLRSVSGQSRNTALCTEMWSGTAAFGHSTPSPPTLLLSAHQSWCLEKLVREVDVLLEKSAWGTACRGLLGKCEYVLAAHTAFVHIMEQALQPSANAQHTSDPAFKAALRTLDVRMVLGAAVIDTEISRSRATANSTHVKQAGGPGSLETDIVGQVLRSAPENPLTFSDLSKRMAQFRRHRSDSVDKSD